MKISSLRKIIEIVIIALGLCFVGYYLSTTSDVKTLVVENDVKIHNDRTIQITLYGEVTNPGTYTVKQGTSLYDVLYLAGGVTDDADIRMYNLSEPLIDSGEIYIKGYNGGVAATRGLPEFEAMDDDKIEYSPENKCNINKASEKDFQNLPGIGETIASRIVEYRINNGDFKSIEEIKNVRGIGQKRFDDIKDVITV